MWFCNISITASCSGDLDKEETLNICTVPVYTAVKKKKKEKKKQSNQNSKISGINLHS